MIRTPGMMVMAYSPPEAPILQNCAFPVELPLFIELEEEGEKGAAQIAFIMTYARPRFARYNPGFIGKPERRRAAY
jgi:hypothetical protein